MNILKQQNQLVRKSIKKIYFNIFNLIAILCFSVLPTVNAFEIENDGWTFSIHGNINTSYIYANCDDSGTMVTGAFLCAGEGQNAISNGYLPTIFEFGLATQREGYDISVHATFDRGLDTNGSFNSEGDDEGFRIWLTLGNDKVGTLLAGRDWGLFAQDATFQDMSVLGVGANFLVNNPVNTQLGAAGTGYIFVDRITQLTYTLPTSEQWGVQIGLFQPLNLSGFSGTSGRFSGAETGSEAIGVHGRLKWNHSNGFISSSFIAQQVDAHIQAQAQPLPALPALASEYTAYGFDITGTYSVSDLGLTGSYYSTEGLGHTGFFIDAVDPAGTERDSDGYLLQATYTLGSTKFGVNYGVSNLDPTAVDAATVLAEKTKITGGIYHSLISGVSLVAEYSRVSAENKAGGEIDNDVVNVGVIFFF